MLSQQIMKLVQSTVPLLEKHRTDIAKRFYKRMFSRHPELLNIFNHTHQKMGRQPEALANAVYLAAKNLHQLESILPVVKQVAEKHRSIGVVPEQYPIVGENLLAAIKDVLGDVATDEVMDAWEQAYGVIAAVFINVEKEMYAEAEGQPGGWAGYRPFIVAKKVKESDVITSFHLKPKDGKTIATYKPGQYISLKVNMEGEKYTHIRQYSLSDAPDKDYYRLSIKREEQTDSKPAGIVSNYMHQYVKEGDEVDLTVPAGDFYLDVTTDRPVVLIAGGVGLTPLMSMFNTLIEKYPNREVYFIQAAKNSHVHAMSNHVAQMTKKYRQVHSYVAYSSPTDEDKQKKSFDKEGYIDKQMIKEVLPNLDCDFYFVGPIPFMKHIYATLKELGVPEKQLNYEFFGPERTLA